MMSFARFILERWVCPRLRRSPRNFYASQYVEPERVAGAQPRLRAVGDSGRWQPEQIRPGRRVDHTAEAGRASECASSARSASRSSCRDCSKPSVPASDRATSRACSWMSRGILRDGSFGQHWGLSGHISQSRLLARYRSVLPSCTVPLVPSRFPPGQW
jgi:hypothetical protein